MQVNLNDECYCLLITFKTIVQLDQAPQNLTYDLDPNRSTLIPDRFYQVIIGGVRGESTDNKISQHRVTA